MTLISLTETLLSTLSTPPPGTSSSSRAIRTFLAIRTRPSSSSRSWRSSRTVGVQWPRDASSMMRKFSPLGVSTETHMRSASTPCMSKAQHQIDSAEDKVKFYLYKPNDMHAKEKPIHANYVTNVFTDEVNRLTSQM